METYDTYCVVPEDMKFAEVLDGLFCFEDVSHHDGVIDHRIQRGHDAVTAFLRLLLVAELSGQVEGDAVGRYGRAGTPVSFS